mmetsp:Transcript_2614/g.6614  ORF Transcript_2614/g.6614 Transcript_2614/m.6614 type:complete len:377 (-) Transcript_2614:1070-2200(-)
MTHSQCHWRDSPHDAQRLGINTVQSQPDTVRTVLQFLNQELQTVAETTLYLHRNARFGTSQRHGLPAIKVDGSGSNNSTEQQQQLHLLALDDARLFVHQQQLWVSYREGKMFGYDAQVLNPIHFDFQSHGGGDNNNGHDLKISATLWASETSSFCCGRNMALLEQEEPQDDDDHNQSTTNETTRTTSRPQQQQQLQSVTWVDPVTVIDVDTTPHVAKQSTRRRLQQQQQQDDMPNPAVKWEDGEEPRQPEKTRHSLARLEERMTHLEHAVQLILRHHRHQRQRQRDEPSFPTVVQFHKHLKVKDPWHEDHFRAATDPREATTRMADSNSRPAAKATPRHKLPVVTVKTRKSLRAPPRRTPNNNNNNNNKIDRQHHW